jgi:HEAT repeat protein
VRPDVLTVVAVVVIAIAQVVFSTVLTVYVVRNRGRRRAAPSGEALHEWLLGRGSAEAVAAYLRSLRPDAALEQVARLATVRVAPERRARLAAAMEHDAWVVRALRGARSRRWWKRFGAVRLLAIVGKPRHRLALHRLLLDRHPAVQLAAASCLGRVNDPELVSLVVETLPRRPTAVRHYLIESLKECWYTTVPLVEARLRPDAPAERLAVWVGLAEAMPAPEVLGKVVRLHGHGASDVRLAVARALRHYFHPDALAALDQLLGDEDWRVRAQAARSLGKLHATGSIERLGEALADGAWWVRFRAGLALTQLGEPGRSVLRATQEGGHDQFAREMATMVSRLPHGGALELAEA